ncbi:unnamed protein product [Protopolystoma xenopodis]|uniref:Uncharacterized protein n=1 Tax=Protopolystoma xenopodis TaxID=117903 RepID=A0A3S5A6S4_9PLAT|nr:unnamed protein product [Protopolystoma xenopodis]
MLDNELEVMENSKVSSGVPLDLTLKSIIQIAPTHLSARHGIQIQNGVKSQEEMPTQYEATYLKDNQSEVGLSIMSLTPLLVQSAPPRLTVSANPNSEKNRMDVTSIDDLVTYNAPDLSNSNLPNPHLVQKEDYGRIIFPQDHASQLAIKTEYSQEELVGSNSRHGAVSSDTPGLSKLNIGSDDNLSGSETLAGQHEFWRMRNMDVAEETKTVARSHIEDIASTHLLSRPISDVETKFTDDLSTVLTDSALLGYKEVGQQVQETRAASPLLETMEECDRLNNLILKDGELEIITKTTTEIIARPTKTVTATSTKNSPLFVKHSECSFTLKPKEESTIDVCQFQPQINKEKLLNSQELSNQVEVSKMRDTILDPERRPLSLNTTITWPSSNYHQKYTNSTPDRPVQSLMETVDLASFDALHIPLNSDLQICESRHVLASKEKKAKTTVCPSPMYSSSVAAMTGAPQLTGHRPYMEKNSFLLFPSILFDYQGQPFLYDLKRINSKERKKRDKATLGTLDAMIRDTLQTVRHHRLA